MCGERRRKRKRSLSRYLRSLDYYADTTSNLELYHCNGMVFYLVSAFAPWDMAVAVVFADCGLRWTVR